MYVVVYFERAVQPGQSREAQIAEAARVRPGSGTPHAGDAAHALARLSGDRYIAWSEEIPEGYVVSCVCRATLADTEIEKALFRSLYPRAHG